MPEKQFSYAVSLAKILFGTREQFVDALRAVAAARIAARSDASTSALRSTIFRTALESHADHAIYAIGRDGSSGIEDNVRFAVDEIVRETLAAVRPGARE